MSRKVHPSACHGLPAAQGSKELAVGVKGLHRGHETIASMSESRFREAFLEESNRQSNAWARRNPVQVLMMHAAELFLLPRAWRRDTPARMEAAREHLWRRAWAAEAARRGREAGAGAAAAAVAAAAAAAEAEAEAKAQALGLGLVMPCRAGSPEARKATEIVKEYLRRITAVPAPSAASETRNSKLPSEVLHDYLCPITAEIMTDPVFTSDGFTYERTAITKWLSTNDTSPSTGATLESKKLIPNIMARCLLRHL